MILGEIVVVLCLAWASFSPSPQIEGKESTIVLDDLNKVEVMAVVGEVTISGKQVARAIRAASVAGGAPNEVSITLVRLTTEHLIDREAVRWEIGETVGPSRMKMKLSEIEQQLRSVDRTMEQQLADTGLSASEFYQELHWDLAWKKHTGELTSEMAIESYWESHKKEWDGTRVGVDQILLLWPEGASDDAREELRQQAAMIADRLSSGSLSWAEAVAEWSMSPLRGQSEQDVVRWIGRFGPMPDAFGEAAFRLEVGQISSPVETPIGIHLIRCVGIRNGSLVLNDVRSDIAKSIVREEFRAIGDRARKKLAIEYGRWFQDNQ